ncbi:hypothetical protein AGMMS49944_31580 [Spirochaetia bacterium]|nr:hypothetical protein AGMMS49944_31580 [Spirochaetia bacterium]
MTIEQTIEILADHRLILDLPQEVPAGKAKIKVFIKPFSKPARLHKPKQTCTEDTPPGYTPPPLDPETMAIMKEVEEKAERERTNPAYRTYIAELRRKCREGPPLFGGIDGMEFQRRARDEWN